MEDITEAQCETRASPGTISNFNQKAYQRIKAWLQRPIEGEHSYIILDGIWLKRRRGGEVRNVSILIAIGVCNDGYREILGEAERSKEDRASWTNFLRYLKGRGLKGVRLFTSDKCLGLVESLADFCPRPAPIKALTGNILAAQNTLVEGERRVGKTRNPALPAFEGLPEDLRRCAPRIGSKGIKAP